MMVEPNEQENRGRSESAGNHPHDANPVKRSIPGVNFEEMNFERMLDSLYSDEAITPLLCAGVYAGSQRKMEYGVAAKTDYLGRGAQAGSYTSFVLEELLPFIYRNYSIPSFKEKAVAGFSLGGLMAMDMVWNHPLEFQKAGIFSGSFWWR